MYYVQGSASLVSLNKDYLEGPLAMPVTESLSITVLIKETWKRLSLTQVQFSQALRVSFQ